MGANFHVACHKCKEAAFALRDFHSTGETLTHFVNKHYDCGRLNPKNVEIVWDYFETPDWFESYKDVTDDMCERYKELSVANESTKKVQT